jgi:acetyltransferase-like isoleucine patch superfamily enzyme
MMKVVNYLLNKLISPKRRFKGALAAGNTSIFLPNFSIVNKTNNKVVVGEASMIGATIIFEHQHGEVIIGNNVYIGSSTIVCKNKVVFEDNILVAWGVTFYDHNSHSLDFRSRQKDIRQVVDDFNNNGGRYLANKDWTTVKSAPITIKQNAWIGMDSLIMKGVTIGEGAIVAARSVVTKDVAPFTIVGGNPAVFIKTVERE